MLPFYILLFYVFVIAGAETSNFREEYHYFKDFDGWLKLHRIPATWQQARYTCQREGGMLAYPSNRTVLSSLISLMNGNRSLPCGVFTGVHSTYTPGSYYSIDGVPLSELAGKWAADNGDNKKTECKRSFKECITLLPDGTFEDVDCSDSFPYICLKKSGDVRACGTIDPEYVYNPVTGSCYKVHQTATHWKDGAKICATEGAHLAIANSAEEAEALKDLFSEGYQDGVGILYHNIVYIGFLSWNGQTWATIHGLPIQDTGYAIWDQSRQDSTVDLKCGAINRSGQLIQAWCDGKTAFICEKTAEKRKGNYSNDDQK